MKKNPISELQGFQLVMDELLNRRGQRVFRKWFSYLKLAEKRGNMIILTAPTSQLADDISLLFSHSELLPVIRQVWPEITGLRIKPIAKPARPRATAAQIQLELAA